VDLPDPEGLMRKVSSFAGGREGGGVGVGVVGMEGWFTDTG
jgi:hypothetical protein